MVVTTIVTTTLAEKHNARYTLHDTTTTDSSTPSRRTSLSSTSLAFATHQPKNISWVRHHAASYKSHTLTHSNSLISFTDTTTHDPSFTITSQTFGSSKSTSVKAYAGDDLHSPALAVTRLSRDGMEVCFRPDEPQRNYGGFMNPTMGPDGLNWIDCKAKAMGRGFVFDLPVGGGEGRRVLWKRTHDEELASWNFSTMDWKLVDSHTNEVLAVYLGKMGKGGKLNWHGDVGGLEGEVVVAASIVAFVSLGIKIGSANNNGSTSTSRGGSSAGSRGH
ncbi:hypothetical protein MBLNU457_3356t2 [Dothideomycetes sp. NU457]